METKAEVWIPLTQGKVAVIDFDDFEKVRDLKWRAMVGWGDTWYAFRDPHSRTQTRMLLHRFLMNASSGEMVDHKDRDGLNNRRDNLRIATRSQNGQNRIKQKGSSKFKGVYWYKRTSKWKAQICVDGHKLSLGYFHSEEVAARAYDDAAIKYFGDYARINFPSQTDTQCLIKDGVAL